MVTKPKLPVSKLEPFQPNDHDHELHIQHQQQQPESQHEQLLTIEDVVIGMPCLCLPQKLAESAFAVQAVQLLNQLYSTTVANHNHNAYSDSRNSDCNDQLSDGYDKDDNNDHAIIPLAIPDADVIVKVENVSDSSNNENNDGDDTNDFDVDDDDEAADSKLLVDEDCAQQQELHQHKEEDSSSSSSSGSSHSKSARAINNAGAIGKARHYQCSMCNKSFGNHSNLMRHKRVHSGAKPFKCLVCAKSFSQSNNLYQHQIIHTGRRPFTCKICKSAFTLTGNLQKHIQRSHPTIGVWQNAMEVEEDLPKLMNAIRAGSFTA